MITIKSEWEIALLKQAGRINAAAHEMVPELLRPGRTTREIDHVLEKFIRLNGGKSSFRAYLGFPGTTCISVNDCVGHGVPGDSPLQEGDVVKVDIGVEYEGYHSDAAATYIVGTATPASLHLVAVTRQALVAGIAAAQVGCRLSDISAAIYQTVIRSRYTTVRNAFGHGIGRHLHEDPQIAPFGPPDYGPRIRPNMVLAIEPVVVAGGRETMTLSDGWTTRTVDRSLAAHFEHTILTTNHGPEVLTTPRNLKQQDSLSLLVRGNMVDLTFKIRSKVDGDRHQMLQLAQQQMNPILVEAWGRPVHPKEVLDPEGAITQVVIDPEGEFAGFYTYSVHGLLHLITLVVHPRYQGLGLGSAIMVEIEKTGITLGLTTVELWVQTNNVRAIRFYERLGYDVVDRPFFNTLAMRKRLEMKESPS